MASAEVYLTTGVVGDAFFFTILWVEYFNIILNNRVLFIKLRILT